MHSFDDLTERMPGGFFVYSAKEEGKILYANAAAIAMFGCASFEEFLKQVNGSFHALVHPDDREAVEGSIQRQIAANEAKRFHVVYRIRQKDEQIRWVENYGQLVCTDPDTSSYYGFLFDITAKKLAEDAALLCEKRLNEAKNTLIVNLAHDLQTPLNAILGYTEQARRDLKDSTALKEHLEKVASAGKVLMAFSNDLLELSEYGADVVHPQMETNDLVTVVGDTLDMLRPQFAAKAIEVTVNHGDVDTHVIMDAPRFQRALMHILFNAAKLTPGAGKVAIAIRQTSPLDSGFFNFEIVVTDTADRAAEALSRKPIDIDLTRSKRIMEMLGGNATVTRENGKGFTFTLSLPLKLVDGTFDTLPSAKLRKTSDKRRVLLVEDIELSRMMVESVLSESGFEVESVSDGCVAVETVAHKPEGYYSAILMDIQMPVMNGYEATRAIRALDRKDVFSLPIIALSSNARMDDKVQSFESGMNEHVAKPIDAEGLIATLNKYLPQK